LLRKSVTILFIATAAFVIAALPVKAGRFADPIHTKVGGFRA
jgi:hypothetical protein